MLNKKLFIAALLLFGVLALAPRANASCVTNYSSVGSHICIKNIWSDGQSTTTITTSCVTLDLAAKYGLNSTAQIVWLYVSTQYIGITAATGQWLTSIDFFRDPACTYGVGTVMPPSSSTDHNIAVKQFSPAVSGGGAVWSHYDLTGLLIYGQTTIYVTRVEVVPSVGIANTIVGEAPMYEQ